LNSQKEEYEYIEAYGDGTWCPAGNVSRSVEVRFRCYPDSLMKIIDIIEPKICFYKMDVGTSLLCKEEKTASTNLGYG
jgi:hypothetical protein